MRSREGNVGPAVDPAQTTRVAEFNDIDSVEAALAHGDVACVLMEPALTNIGIVLPEDGFLEAVRDACTRAGTLLIIDETHTLSAGPGGCTAAWGLEPDAVTLGKSIGGGVPIGAYGVTRRAGRAHRRRGGGRLRGHRRGRRHAGRQRAVARGRARDARRGADRRRRSREMSRLRERFVAGVEEALERHAVPWSVVSLGARAEYRFCPRAAAHRRGVGGRRRPRPRGVSAPVPAQPRRADHAVPQHGADVPGDDRGPGRSPHARHSERPWRSCGSEPSRPAPSGLKKNALGYVSNVVIGVASTAPGYSIAATLGFIVADQGVGLQAPAVMLVAFVPMFCIAFAYRYMNKADPDCGTTFSWVTRGLGPSLGLARRLGDRRHRRDRDGEPRADRGDLHASCCSTGRAPPTPRSR